MENRVNQSLVIEARKKAQQVVSDYRKIADRVTMLENWNYRVEEVPMGPGGVLQEKAMSDGSIRIQVGCGHGRYNYAMAIILTPNQ